MCENENLLLKKVYETGFALDEITLYLDTHPTDPQAMEYYRYAQRAKIGRASCRERVSHQV